MSKSDVKNTTSKKNNTSAASVLQNMTDDEVRTSLGLVKTKSGLLALFNVPSLPILQVLDSSFSLQANEQILYLYNSQTERTRQLYLASAKIRPIYLAQHLKNQFFEYEQYKMSIELDKRAYVDTELVTRLWQQLHLVDELISELVQNMPAHTPVGWQISSQSKNYLKLPTAGKPRYQEAFADQSSINSYVLGHFGVMSYTYDKSYFIGHVLGYLFICYYFSYLSINYGVSPLSQSKVKGYDYQSLSSPYLVRLLQTLDGESKKRIYQLAIICAKLSSHATDKRIEKLLIAEVNDFSKKEQKRNIERWLEEGVMPLPYFEDDGSDNNEK